MGQDDTLEPKNFLAKQGGGLSAPFCPAADFG